MQQCSKVPTHVPLEVWCDGEVYLEDRAGDRLHMSSQLQTWELMYAPTETSRGLVTAVSIPVTVSNKI